MPVESHKAAERAGVLENESRSTSRVLTLCSALAANKNGDSFQMRLRKHVHQLDRLKEYRIQQRLQVSGESCGVT